jgi:hypothetical protein
MIGDWRSEQLRDHTGKYNQNKAAVLARRKSPVWSTEVTYLPGSTAGVPGGRSAALILRFALGRQAV